MFKNQNIKNKNKKKGIRMINEQERRRIETWDDVVKTVDAADTSRHDRAMHKLRHISYHHNLGQQIEERRKN